MNQSNRERMVAVAASLGELCGRVVFLGGAVVDLYATSSAAPAPRVTDDVDVVIDITSRGEYSRLEETLRKKGFVHDMSAGAPICRWIVGGVKVDVMPTGGDILGFTNSWYKSALDHSHAAGIAQGITIKIPDAAYYFVTKLEAARSRGMADLRTSQDFEDIVYLLRNRRELSDEITAAGDPVKSLVTQVFSEWLDRDTLDESISAALGFGELSGTGRAVRRIMEQLAAR